MEIIRFGQVLDQNRKKISVMIKEEVLSIVRCGENSRVQFKEKISGQKQIADELVAFANSKGGIIVFGAKDKTGEITGLSYEEVQIASREIGNAAQEYVKPTIYIQTETFPIGNDRMLLVVTIGEGVNKPYTNISGEIYVKQGADKRRITENSEILRLFHQSGSYNPDQETIQGTSIDDIDETLIESYTQKNYLKKVGEMGVPYEQLLKNLRIIGSDGKCTLAGLLFFGKTPQKYEPSFMIKAVSFYGNDMGGVRYRDSRDLIGTIPLLFEQAMNFFKVNLHSVQSGQSFNSTGKLEISEVALEEITQNALVHREYIQKAPIRILIFDNRVEIISPGTLPTGMSIDDLKLGNTIQRNHLIAMFCSKTMQYRGLGTGILRAMREESGIEFENSDGGNQFKVIFHRKTDELEEKGYESDITDVFQTYPNLSVICPQLQKTEHNNAKLVLHICKRPASMLELMEATGYDSKTSFRRKLLIPLISSGLIEATNSDKHNSPQQKYILAGNGMK